MKALEGLIAVCQQAHTRCSRRGAPMRTGMRASHTTRVRHPHMPHASPEQPDLRTMGDTMGIHPHACHTHTSAPSVTSGAHVTTIHRQTLAPVPEGCANKCVKMVGLSNDVFTVVTTN